MGCSNIGFGALGAMVYLGLTTGSLVAAKLFQNSKNIKPILITCMAANCVTLVTFGLAPNFYIALLLRLLTGFFQIFVMIYTPVWADAFGSEREKSIWMSLFQTCAPLGICIGFAIVSVLNQRGTWEWAFYIQGILCLPGIVGIMATDTKFFDIDSVTDYRKQCRKKILGQLDLPENYLSEKEDEPEPSQRNSAAPKDIPTSVNTTR